MIEQAALDRFFVKLDPPNERGCREWNAATDDGGYGLFQFGGKLMKAHRVAFFIANGYWPEETRHACDNPPCCEPEHLLDGTTLDNVMDMVERGRHVNVKKDRCPAGHPYDETNTYIRSEGWRSCRACCRDRARRRRSRLASGGAI